MLVTLADLAEHIGTQLDRPDGRRLPARLGGTRMRLKEVHTDHVVVSGPRDVLRRLGEALREERAP